MLNGKEDILKNVNCFIDTKKVSESSNILFYLKRRRKPLEEEIHVFLVRVNWS